MQPADEECPKGAFRLGEWLVSPSLNRLSRAGTVVHLRPKAMDVLVFLARRPGEVVSTREVLDAVWARRFLADSALSRAVHELREVLGDEAHGPTYIETIAKRGYRLIAPVVPVDAAAGAVPSPSPEVSLGGVRVRLPYVLAAGAAVVAVLAGWFAVFDAQHARRATAPVAKRIIVLPFENLGTAGDEYLAAAVSDEIAGRLTKAGGVAVVAHPRRPGPAIAGKGAGEIGRALGVEYVLAGTVQWDRGGPGAGRVRITPRLVRAADDTQVWADVYDYGIEDIFRVQSEIALNVITEVGITLAEPERRAVAARPTSSLDAWQAFMRGLHYMRLPNQRGADVRLGLAMFERAVALDPDFALAHAGIGEAHSLLYQYEMRTVEEHRVRAREAFERALSLAPADPDVHHMYALYLYWCHRAYDAALSEVAVAKRGRRDSPYPWEAAGLVLRRRAEWQASVDSFRMASQLNPGDALPLYHAGVTLSLMRRHEEAAESLDRSLAALPDEPMTYAAKVENLWRWKGDLARARAVLEAAPGPETAALARHRYWQDVYEGRYDAAIQRLARLPAEAAGLGDLQHPRALLLALAQRLSGEAAAARASSRTALAELDRALLAAPGNPYLRAFRGIALAGLGRPDEAIAEGEGAVAACPIAGDAVDGAEVLESAAQIYAMVGERSRALDALGRLLSVPSRVSAALLAVDPRWRPLRGLPEFHALLAERATDGLPGRAAGTARP
jgi:DNA-binding winged helix-turn-helix (wHTH) protein/TolB-like protein/tetratricopeptide (TPR) repeat protein